MLCVTGMKPIQCVISSDTGPSCVMQIGTVMARPIFNHLGSNLTYPQLCDCTLLTTEILNDKKHNCNMFRFLSGLVYVNSAYDVAYQFALRHKLGSAEAVNVKSHQAMFTASSYGQVIV